MSSASGLGRATTARFEPVRWGVLGVAKIAVERVVPPASQSACARFVAIASRNLARAESAARALGIERAYGSYERLLDDPEIEAVYIPLPNHMHVEWTLRSIAAGKHVLCEKPLALSAAEVRRITIAASRASLHVMEGFMLFSHPRWHAVRDLLRGGQIGDVGAIHISFANPNLDAANIRNRIETGGGALYDKGCYAIALARHLFDAEPDEVAAMQCVDAGFGVDHLTAGILRFPQAVATFDCSSRLAAHQSLLAVGAKGRMEVPVPVTPTDAAPTWLRIDPGRDLAGTGARDIAFAPCNQYRLMFEAFAEAVRCGAAVPVPLAFSLGNAAALESIVASARAERSVHREPTR